MPDFRDDIAKQSGGALSRSERQTIRFFVERALNRERLKNALNRYISWWAPAVALALTLTTLWSKLFTSGGH